MKYIVRCLACHYIQEGKSYKTIYRIIKYSRQSIGEWVKMYNEGGMDKSKRTKSVGIKSNDGHYNLKYSQHACYIQGLSLAHQHLHLAHLMLQFKTLHYQPKLHFVQYLLHRSIRKAHLQSHNIGVVD